MTLVNDFNDKLKAWGFSNRNIESLTSLHDILGALNCRIATAENGIGEINPLIPNRFSGIRYEDGKLYIADTEIHINEPNQLTPTEQAALINAICSQEATAKAGVDIFKGTLLKLLENKISSPEGEAVSEAQIEFIHKKIGEITAFSSDDNIEQFEADIKKVLEGPIITVEGNKINVPWTKSIRRGKTLQTNAYYDKPIDVLKFLLGEIKSEKQCIKQSDIAFQKEDTHVTAYK